MRKVKSKAAATPPVGLGTTVSAKDGHRMEGMGIQVDEETPSPRNVLCKYLGKCKEGNEAAKDRK